MWSVDCGECIEYEPKQHDGRFEYGSDADKSGLLMQMRQDQVDQDQHLTVLRLNLERQYQIPNQTHLRGGTNMSSYHSTPALALRSCDSEQKIFQYLSELSIQYGFTLMKGTGGSKASNREARSSRPIDRAAEDFWMVLCLEGGEGQIHRASRKCKTKSQRSQLIAVDREALKGPGDLILAARSSQLPSNRFHRPSRSLSRSMKR